MKVILGISPVSNKEFAAMMAVVGLFEASPRLAVAVSGGGDSMALCLLADAWARARGGCAHALTVDHGLRPGSAKEAEQVSRWLAARRIDHHILRWQGAKPATGVQAAARMARYKLMTSWAAKAGALHLLIAHTMEDQAETFLLRLERGSGFDGLSSMAAVLETSGVRLARPLLGISRQCLRNTLSELGQDWIEDPSNKNPQFTRTHARAAVGHLAEKGIRPQRLAAAARNFGQARMIMDSAVSTLLAHGCAFHPAGHAVIDTSTLAAAPKEASLRGLSRILVCVGGGAYSPRREKLARLHEQLIGNAGEDAYMRYGTLGGCRVLPIGQGRLLVCREARGTPEPIAAVPGTKAVWDGRFSVEFTTGQLDGDEANLTRLGQNGWDEIVAERPKMKDCDIPQAARASLPALRDERGIRTVPHLKYRRSGWKPTETDIRRITFFPKNSASGTGFFLV